MGSASSHAFRERGICWSDGQQSRLSYVGRVALGVPKEGKTVCSAMGRPCANSEDEDEDLRWDPGVSRPGFESTVWPLGWWKDSGLAIWRCWKSFCKARSFI